MPREIFREFLGDVPLNSFQRSFTPGSGAAVINIELIRQQAPRGFKLYAEFSIPVRGPDEQVALMQGKAPTDSGKQLMRLVLESLPSV
jgi:hypothetical protein